MEEILTESGLSTQLATKPLIFNEKAFRAYFEELQKLENAEATLSIAPRYAEFTEGVARRGIYMGKKMLSGGKDGKIEAVVWAEVDGCFVHGGVALREALSALTEGTPIEITLKGRKPTRRGGQVMLFDVRILIEQKEEEVTKLPF